MVPRTPDFEHGILRVLHGERPVRATLYELFLNPVFYRRLAGHSAPEPGPLGDLRLTVEAMAAAGYDYATCQASAFHFRDSSREKKSTLSLNGQAVITDRASYERFRWPDPRQYPTEALDGIGRYLPDGMKLMLMGPGGVLENVLNLVGYDNLCILLGEDPDLVREIFDRVGERLVWYYESAVQREEIGFLCSNDDWGFNTQTFLSPADMRRYIFPWHKRIVEIAHRAGKPCMLHSCGYFAEVVDDIVEMGFDARHSYEDNILPVEKAYPLLHDRMAVLGGIDMNFLVTRTPEEVYDRSRRMLERTWESGGYALGSGNSIPEYVPYENYLAMNRAALEFEA